MRSVMLLVTSIALLATASDSEAKAKKQRRANVHRVSRGEKLYLVAERYGCSIDELRDANGLSGRIRLAPGMKLTIPPCAKNERNGQSVGAPWDGRLVNPSKLKTGKGYVIRRGWRVFGTRTTIEFVADAIRDFREENPKTHTLLIGDISEKRGGKISQHHSHQSGRDIDLGLIYKKKPAAFPANFVKATAENLDAGKTWSLIRKFTRTANKEGGVQVVFLDYKVQGLLYEWAKDHGVDEETLSRTLQFPRGKDNGSAVVRHEPHHADHLHVRFKCGESDKNCF